MKKPVVAIIGRPNVGKSTFFNFIAGKRISIVENIPGVTRDRIYEDVEWRGRIFAFVDTGGLEIDSKDSILMQMRRQVEIAIELADVILFMVDAKDGVTANDKEIANMLRRFGKPLLLVVNKVDNIGEPPPEVYEFYNLGIGEFFCISSSHGLGIGEVLDRVYDLCPESKFEDDEEDIIKVAVVGKPNVGKSSLINKILGEDRVIVSDVPGTTRDAIDTYYTIDDQKFCFIDTAGLRKRGKITDNIERYSTMRSLRAVDRSDVVLVLIDATEGVTEQDTKIAGYAHNQGKASIILVNKWDLIEKDSKTVEEYRNAVYNKLGFMLYAPIEFISAKTGQRVNKLVDMIQRVASTSETRIPTGMLNDVLNDAMLMVQPPSDKGRRLKIYYMTQVKVKPPTFVIFCNDQKLFHYSYLRYIENQMRTNFGFEGTPLVFIVRERNEDDK
ncbi:MAG TPA: ribosome biogenesis GTPase Der [Clostridiaceae bacterium]|jgi:GTP-binding protein|nr:ribosome biogenesis GTPase Der [Clostridiaceae bacterium]